MLNSSLAARDGILESPCLITYGNSYENPIIAFQHKNWEIENLEPGSVLRFLSPSRVQKFAELEFETVQIFHALE